MPFSIPALNAPTVMSTAAGGEPTGDVLYVKLENVRLPTDEGTVVKLPRIERVPKSVGKGIMPAWAFNPPKASRPTAKLKISERLVMEPPEPTFPGFGVVVGRRIAPSPGAGNGKSRTACAARVEPIS